MALMRRRYSSIRTDMSRDHNGLEEILKLEACEDTEPGELPASCTTLRQNGWCENPEKRTFMEEKLQERHVSKLVCTNNGI
ncbi:hypothetical protein OSTOST_22673 [Ostertagia ostertagi]